VATAAGEVVDAGAETAEGEGAGRAGLAPVATDAAAKKAADGGGDRGDADVAAPDTPPRQWWDGVRRTRSAGGAAAA
jgi:hypothetical protein